MLAKEKPQIVSIGDPLDLHRDMVSPAPNLQGEHLLEAAVHLAEADEMLAACEATSSSPSLYKRLHSPRIVASRE